MIVLDTSAVIEYTKGNPKLVEIVRSAEDRGESVAATSVTLFELLTPIFHKGMMKKERVIRAFLQNLRILDFGREASEESARIMSGLLKIGRPVNVLDVLIAGIAEANKCEALVCTDSDFKEIKKVTSLGISIIA